MPRIAGDPALTRAQLLDAALACFAESGFEGTSVRAIAQRAGVSLGLLYHYFPSKEAVVRALFDRSAGLIQGVFIEAAAEAEPQARIERLLRASFRVMREQREFYRISGGARFQPGVLSTLSAEIAAWDVAVRGLWQALLDELGFSDSGVHARLLIASLDGICQHFAMDPENYPLEAVGERLILLLADPALPGGKK